MFARLFNNTPKCYTPDELISLIQQTESEEEIKDILHKIDNIRLLNLTHFHRTDFTYICAEYGDELAMQLAEHMEAHRSTLGKLLKKAYEFKTQSPDAELIRKDFNLSLPASESKNFSTCTEAWDVFVIHLSRFMRNYPSLLEADAKNRRYQELISERIGELMNSEKYKF